MTPGEEPRPEPDANQPAKHADSLRDLIDRHLWQIQPVRDVLVIVGIGALFYLGYLLRLVTVPILLALLFAYLFEPITRRLERTKWLSRQGAAGTLIAVIVLAIVLPLGLGLTYAAVQGFGFIRETASGADTLVRFAGQWDREAGTEEMAFEDKLSAQDESVRDLYRNLPNEKWEGLAQFYITEVDPEAGEIRFIEDWIRNNADQIAKSTIGTGADAVRFLVRTFTSVAALGFGLFLTAFFFFFIASGYPHVLEWGRKLIPDKHRDRTLDLIHQMDGVVSGFVRGRLSIMVIQIFVFTIAYWLIGVPAALLLGLLVGVLSIVPYLALVGIPISIAMMWLDGPTEGFRAAWWWTLGAPVVVYFAGQALDDYVWTPVIQGKSTNMDTPTILFASLAGGVLFGVYGLLIAIPVAACLKILLRELFWPRFQEWVEGKREDPLPVSRGEGE